MRRCQQQDRPVNVISFSHAPHGRTTRVIRHELFRRFLIAEAKRQLTRTLSGARKLAELDDWLCFQLIKASLVPH